MRPDIAERVRSAAEAYLVKHGPQCSVCILPDEVLEIVRTLRRAGKPYTAIIVGLKEAGVRMTPGTLSKHFRDHESQG